MTTGKCDDGEKLSAAQHEGGAWPTGQLPLKGS